MFEVEFEKKKKKKFLINKEKINIISGKKKKDIFLIIKI